MARTAGSSSSVTGPRVYAAAQKLFARHGFAAVSMRQIASEVGVQVGALYSYTPDKQSLLAGLMRSHMDELHKAWAAQAEPPDPPSALAQFVEFHIRFHLARPEAVFIAYMELRNLSEENFAEIEALRRNYENVLETILRAGRDRGDFCLSDLRITTLAIIGLLTETTTWYRSPGRLDQDQIVGIYLDMLRKLVA